ncbi:hypothetical protein HRI_000122700 [Hibiscus trionum]|uniref:Uncharacterized protein n=1 Tax=Hibiscus trionum TaxID=183268 RepID=A0A9W7LHS1_HIBTR|nr:hypothetical protein HRI_000122700 [Hibiscus trionum]
MTMMKRFSIANFVSILLLLVVVQVHGKSEFSLYSEASKFSQETQQFSLKIPSISDEISLLPESELPQHYDTSRSPVETQYLPDSNPEETCSFPESEFSQGSLQLQNFPFETSRPSEYGFSKDFESSDEPPEIQQVSYEINSHRKIKLPPPSPSPAVTPYPKNACEFKCSIKCLKEGFPLLNFCNNVCKTGCLFRYSELIYNCTNYCAKLMPLNFKSDKKKADGYLKYCFKKCIKVF